MEVVADTSEAVTGHVEALGAAVDRRQGVLREAADLRSRDPRRVREDQGEPLVVPERLADEAEADLDPVIEPRLGGVEGGVVDRDAAGVHADEPPGTGGGDREADLPAPEHSSRIGPSGRSSSSSMAHVDWCRVHIRGESTCSS